MSDPAVDGVGTGKSGPRRLCVEVVDREMAALLAAMSPAERLAIAVGLFESARRILASELASAHPEWGVDELERAVAARLAHAG